MWILVCSFTRIVYESAMTELCIRIFIYSGLLCWLKPAVFFYLQTSFLSLVPDKLFDLTTPTTSQYMPAVNSSVRNAKSSIDFLEDMNNEILMLNQSKCHTPMVFISKKASPYPLMEVSCLQPWKIFWLCYSCESYIYTSS